MSTSIEVDAPHRAATPTAVTPGAATPTAAVTAGEPGLIEDAGALTLELRALLHDQFQLFTLETRLAAKSLMTMIAAALCIGMLLATAWLGLMAVVVLTLMETGVPAMLAYLMITLLSLAVTLLLYAVIRDRARLMGYSATLRALKQPLVRRGDQ